MKRILHDSPLQVWPRHCCLCSRYYVEPHLHDIFMPVGVAVDHTVFEARFYHSPFLHHLQLQLIFII